MGELWRIIATVAVGLTLQAVAVGIWIGSIEERVAKIEDIDMRQRVVAERLTRVEESVRSHLYDAKGR